MDKITTITYLGDPRPVERDEFVTVGGQLFYINQPVEVTDKSIIDALKDSEYFSVTTGKPKVDSDDDSSGTGTKGAAKAGKNRGG